MPTPRALFPRDPGVQTTRVPEFGQSTNPLLEPGRTRAVLTNASLDVRVDGAGGSCSTATAGFPVGSSAHQSLSLSLAILSAGSPLALQLPCSMLEATQEQEQLDTAMSRHGGKPCRS